MLSYDGFRDLILYMDPNLTTRLYKLIYVQMAITHSYTHIIYVQMAITHPYTHIIYIYIYIWLLPCKGAIMLL